KLHGMVSIQVLATPMIGLARSSSVKAMAFSMARAGARSRPSRRMRLRCRGSNVMVGLPARDPLEETRKIYFTGRGRCFQRRASMPDLRQFIRSIPPKCVWFDLDISPDKTNRTRQDEKTNQDEPRRIGPFQTNQTNADLSGWP